MSFIRVFAREGRPLNMFLDDLQWADANTFRLMRIITNNFESLPFLLLGAYRDQEIRSSHPFRKFLGKFGEERSSITMLHLDPFSPEDIESLLLGKFQAAPDINHALARIVYKRTGGNPLFIQEYPHSLIQDGFLARDEKTKKSAAYEFAYSYLLTGMELSEEKYVPADNLLRLNLYREAGECAAFLGNFSESARLLEDAVKIADHFGMYDQALHYLKLEEKRPMSGMASMFTRQAYTTTLMGETSSGKLQTLAYFNQGGKIARTGRPGRGIIRTGGPSCPGKRQHSRRSPCV